MIQQNAVVKLAGHGEMEGRVIGWILRGEMAAVEIRLNLEADLDVLKQTYQDWESHDTEKECWCARCKEGAGLMEDVRTTNLLTGRERRQIVYTTGAGEGEYIIEPRYVRFYGTTRSLHSGSLYVEFHLTAKEERTDAHE